MTFKRLNIGEDFEFSDPSEFSQGKIYRRVGQRKYCLVGFAAEPKCRKRQSNDYSVGTINVRVKNYL